MMTNGNIFRVTGPLWEELTGHRWIPLTKASGAELWCFLWSALSKGMSKQSRHRWFETPSRPLWRHCNDDKYINTLGSLVFGHYRSCCWYQLNTLSCFDLHVLVIIRRPHRESDRIKLNDSHSVNNQFNSAANHRPFVKCLWIKKKSGWKKSKQSPELLSCCHHGYKAKFCRRNATFILVRPGYCVYGLKNQFLWMIVVIASILPICMGHLEEIFPILIKWRFQPSPIPLPVQHP